MLPLPCILLYRVVLAREIHCDEVHCHADKPRRREAKERARGGPVRGLGSRLGCGKEFSVLPVVLAC